MLVRKLVLGDSVWALYREKENAGYSADVFARRWDCQESGYSCSAAHEVLKNEGSNKRHQKALACAHQKPAQVQKPNLAVIDNGHQTA